MSETMVDVNDVSIMFRLYRENVDNLKEFMIKKLNVKFPMMNFGH